MFGVRCVARLGRRERWVLCGQRRRLKHTSCSDEPVRGQFASLSDSDLARFEQILGKQHVKTTEIEDFNRDFMQWYQGKSQCVLLPESSEQVSDILRHCHDRRIAVVPQGGNTGLVGGSISVFDEVVLSTRRLNQHFELDTSSGILECDAGFVLEDLDNRLAAAGYMMPLDLGAKGSCQIGGNVSTCAGGVRLLRYGSMHSNVLGLDVVVPDAHGTVLRLGSALRKDNTSLHSYHLFIGSEGQLGVVTRVRLLAAPRPTSVHSALLAVSTFDDVRALLRLAKSRLSDILSSFELMDAETMRCLEENMSLANVLSSKTPFNVLVETSGFEQEHDSAKFSAFLESALETGVAADGVLAESVADAAYMWKLRENATLALMSDGFVYKNDVSLPLEHFYRLTEVLRERLEGHVTRIICYGHVGDGNAHVNITGPEFRQNVYDRIYPFLYEWVAQHGGSISAEHGIGRLKRPYRHLGKSPVELDLNRRLKHIFDPRGILSPYKLIDSL